MSRRFGRNQRRRLRAEVAESKSLLNWYIEKYHTMLGDYKHIVEAIEKVQPYSLLTPIKTVSGQPNNHYNVAIHKQFMVNMFADQPPQMCEVDECKLSKIEMTVEEHHDKFETLIHLRVAGKAEVGYYLSEQAMYQFGVPYEIIAKDIYEQFRNNSSYGKKVLCEKG